MARRVTPPEAAALLAQGWTYVDVRSEPEFLQGHPAGAVNIPLLHAGPGRMTQNPDFLTVVEATFPPQTKLVVGCKSGPRSLQALALLGTRGYHDVVDVRGGFAGERDAFGRVVVTGWQASGLPVATTPAPGCSYADLCRKRRNNDEA